MAENPKPNTQEIFRITKSENRNTVIYEAVLDPQNPDQILNVHPYWIKVENGGNIQEINWIESKWAYGVKVEENNKTELRFHVVALPKDSVLVKKVDGVWKGVVNIDGVMAYIEGIYIDVTTVILIKPTVHSLTITAKAVDDGREVKKVIIP